MSDLITHFSKVTDERREQGKRHALIDIIAIAIVGVICGADDWVSIELVGKAKEKWFRTFLELPHGIPSHDTFGKVFAWLDPEEFQACFMEWIRDIATMSVGQVIAIDGKTIRRSHDQANGKGPIHLVNAWASQNELVIGQRKVESKSNEITAIPELLRMLDVHGCIVTIDAIGTQKEIAKQIRAQKADYVLAVKGNQGDLHFRISSMFAVDRKEGFKASPFEHARTVNKGHGRIEIRNCWVTGDPEYLGYADPEQKWDGLRSIAIIESIRRTDTKETKQLRYFISSLEPEAAKMLSHVRAHWGVENQLHWSLDMVFREDENRARKGHTQENFAMMRKIALNVLRKEKTKKCGAKGKRLICAMDHDYLLKVLHQ
ncbi:MAG: ISAs1 family transposase [Desulfobulbaceae bacterium]|nr:ISAs1 family transposase [Desulfobulbaceae bacterium]